MNIVKQSLLLCIGALVALLAMLGAQSLWQVSRLSAATDAVVAGGTLATASEALRNRFVATQDLFRTAISFVDTDSAADHRKAFAERVAELRAAAGRVRDDAGSETARLAAEVAKEVEAWTALTASHLSTEGVTELPAYDRIDLAGARVQSSIDALVRESGAAMQATVAQSHAQARNATLWTIGELALALALGVGLGRHAVRSLHRQLGADASEVARIANAVADGDLTIGIRTATLPPDSVMAATARMQRALIETVGRVRTISHQLSTGADQIASGNHDLSARTEQQAGAIEKTVSTMQELGATVQANTAHARRADELARGAAEVAIKGGAVVGQVVATMQGINDSSKRIADIIGTIDGIAFQTNILALNAAVEAARAGEQGRGFAVVAGEVRSLAQRSAQAAREIKTLIGASVERVEAGTRLVDEAGSTMQEIVGAIRPVTEIMGRISQASEAQTNDVSQVGRAVGEIDRTTQQNATLAHESAAAADTLRVQARELVEAVSVFRTRDVAEAAAAL